MGVPAGELSVDQAGKRRGINELERCRRETSQPTVNGGRCVNITTRTDISTLPSAWAWLFASPPRTALGERHS